MQKHLVGDIVEQYVIGALDPESVRFVEGHVAQCPACAQLLQAEARVELSLHEVASMQRVVSLSSRRKRVTALVAAVAAVLLGVVAFGGLWPQSGSAPPSLRDCSEPSTSRSCIDRAQFDGELTIGPRGEPIVPRYDVSGGLP